MPSITIDQLRAKVESMSLDDLIGARAKAHSDFTALLEETRQSPAGFTAEADTELGWLSEAFDVYNTQVETRKKYDDLAKFSAEIDQRSGQDGDRRLERDVSRSGDTPEQQYRAVFAQWMAFGSESLSSEQRQVLASGEATDEKRAQSVGTVTAGGYTVPAEFWAKVTETMVMFSGARELGIEIINTDVGTSIPWPTNDDTANKGAILAENTQITEQDLVFGQANLPTYTYTSKLVRVSLQLIRDSGIDIEGFLARKLGERLGRIFNEHWTTGTGTAQPQGFMTGATVGKTAASQTAVTYAELVDLVYSVDPAYLGGDSGGNTAGRFTMHNLTLGAIRKIVDGNSQPIWNLGPGWASATGGAPATILGFPYVPNNDVAQMTASARSIGFGNYRAAYVGRLVTDASVMRLAERYADYLQVGFFGFQSMGGVTQDASAAKVLAQAA